MSTLLTAVKTAIAAATEDFHRQMADTPDMVLALTSAGKTLPEMRARAAAKAVLDDRRADVCNAVWNFVYGEMRGSVNADDLSAFIEGVLKPKLTLDESGED